MKDKIAAEKPRGEASLRGHLKNPDGTEKEDDLGEPSGSAAYVAKDPEKDTQLQYAINFLHGTAKGPETASATPSPAPTTTGPTSGSNNKSPVPSDDDKKVTPN